VLRLLIACVACAGLALAPLGCGGTSSRRTASGQGDGSSTRAEWATRTQQLCREKRVAIGRLGYVHITYAGIAREGLARVKGLLDDYLGRLLGVLRDFYQRQQQIATPPPLRPTVAMATEVDLQSQTATSRVRRDVASATTASALSAAFSAWIATLQRLAARGDALAQELNLPACRSGTGAASPPSSTANRVGSESPRQVLADAVAAFRGANGYVMQGTLTQNGRRAQLNVAATSSRTTEVTFTAGRAVADVIQLPTWSYIRGNQAFWRSSGSPAAAALADEWIRFPSARRGFMTQFQLFEPATLGRCLAENHGTLSIGGRTTIDGQPAILLRDAGNVPGGTPGVLAVAATGTPYPLRVTVTGKSRPGGRIDVCNDGKGDTTGGVLNFRQYGNVAPIQPPAHALEAPSPPNA
jgi:hypothetical protein